MSDPPDIVREYVRYALRAGTANELSSRNEVLLERELACETDTGRFKLGDGVTAFNDLEYIPLGDVARMRATATHLEWRPNAFSAWVPLIALSEVKGDPGDPAFVEFQRTDTHVQWRNSPSVSWVNLIPLELLKGEDGKDVELLDILEVGMRSTESHIQWRPHLTAPWENLVSKSELRGEDGTVGMRTSDSHIQWRSGNTGPYYNLVTLESLRGIEGPPGPSQSAFPTASFSSVYSDIAVGTYCDLPIRHGFTVLEYMLESGQQGQFEVDVYVQPFGTTAPPTSLRSICGTDRPRIQGTRSARNANLTDWSVYIPPDSSIRFIVTHCLGIRNATLKLVGYRDA